MPEHGFRMEIMVLPGATEVHAIIAVTATLPPGVTPVGEAMLYVQPIKGARVRFLRQTKPVRDELARQPEEKAYRTGTWANETREYHLCLETPPLPESRGVVAARLFLVTDTESLAEGNVLANRATGYNAPPPPLP